MSRGSHGPFGQVGQSGLVQSVQVEAEDPRGRSGQIGNGRIIELLRGNQGGPELVDYLKRRVDQPGLVFQPAGDRRPACVDGVGSERATTKGGGDVAPLLKAACRRSISEDEFDQVLEVDHRSPEEGSASAGQASLPAEDVVGGGHDEDGIVGDPGLEALADEFGPAGVRGAFDDGQGHGATLWSGAAGVF